MSGPDELFDDDDLDQTVTMRAQDSRDQDDSRWLQLVVIGDGTYATHPLTENTTLTIGRSRRADITIEHDSMSRNHAQLRVGEVITIEDLGSHNGTHLRGAQLPANEPVPLAVGELVSFGNVAVILQQRSEPALARKLYSHDDFRGRVAEECARVARSNGSFALLRIQVARQTPSTFVESTLGEVLRASDVLGKLAPHVYCALLLDAMPIDAENGSRRIHGQLVQRRIESRLLVASCPRDGKTVAELFAKINPLAETPTAGPEIVVSDQQMKRLYELIRQVAPSNIGVLLLGETGVGKEVFARAVHRASSRASGPFVDINCAALTESLLESELFGHEKGAFTHAVAAKPGLLESADGGTVFLDEIGDMPLATQVKLLRVIEDSQLRRVGSLKSRRIDVRFVAATNVDLEAQVARGTFRRDLFFRLNGVTIVIPALHERVAEIEPLARAFVQRAAGTGIVPSIASETLEKLRAYPWPGNVRELKHVIERAVALCGGGQILPEHLPPAVVMNQRPAAAAANDSVPLSDAMPARPLRKGDEEQQWILQALEKTGGNQTLAAKILGISRRTLINRLNEYEALPRPRKDKRTPSDD